MNKNSDEINYHSGHRERMRQRFDADPEMMTFQEHEMLEFILNTVTREKIPTISLIALIAAKRFFIRSFQRHCRRSRVGKRHDRKRGVSFGQYYSDSQKSASLVRREQYEKSA